jgi:2-(1,2-epoxy-1,2-dihydrophenyl)acetyl-CoA isomerase
MSEGSPIEVSISDGTATVSLSRPDRGNALDLTTAEALLAALRHVTTQEDVRVVVLRAHGKRFCVGGDLQAFRAAPPGANLCDRLARPLHDAIKVMAAARQPVVCVVQGAVGGGANGLVLASDIVIAAESTIFRLGYTGSGLTPDCGVTWELPRRVGMATALDLILTNRRVTASEALQLGVVSRVIPDDQLTAAAKDVLAALALVPVETLAESKRLARKSRSQGLPEQLDEEAVTIGRIGDTQETREAIAAFLDKRAPKYAI